MSGDRDLCVFCEGEIPPGAPPEHVIAKWFTKFRPKGAVFRHTERPEIRGNVEHPPRVPEFSSKKFDLTANTICPVCNHGWMSDLENDVSTLLTAIIEGEDQGLSVDRQVLLSRWVTKTALTWDQSKPRQRRFFPLHYCRWLHDHQLPPPGATIRLGRYLGDSREFVQMIYDGLYREAPANPEAPGMPQGHRAIMRIGQFVGELTITEEGKPVLRETGDIASLLVTIWPSVEAQSWPPRVALDDDIWRRFVGPDKLDRSAA